MIRDLVLGRANEVFNVRPVTNLDLEFGLNRMSSSVNGLIHWVSTNNEDLYRMTLVNSADLTFQDITTLTLGTANGVPSDISTSSDGDVIWIMYPNGVIWQYIVSTDTLGTYSVTPAGVREIRCDLSGTNASVGPVNGFLGATRNLEVKADATPGFVIALNGVDTNSGVKQWSSIDCGLGGKIVATEATGFIYTSVDSGVTWRTANHMGSKNWLRVRCSDDFKSIIALEATSKDLYESNDEGLTWVRCLSASDFTSIDISVLNSNTDFYAITNASLTPTGTAALAKFSKT